jgi:hypothetical protein
MQFYPNYLITMTTHIDRGLFHFRRAAFSVTLKEKVDCTLTKATVLRISLNIDGTPITSHI